ncbi:MAG: ParB N-terminal domain-containing protein [Lachnospiraceae bacterium]|nr:ParB N-terminal domain-containing protein [Lachnospiraceae bacterium]
MRIEERALDQIQPYEKNPRKNEAAVDKVAESLREFGWQQPIVTDRDGVIIAGHTRLMAAQRLGLKTAPVVVAEGLSEEQVKAYRLADNKTNEFASWDIGMLNEELFDIGEIDMSLFGFDMGAFTDGLVDGKEFFERESVLDTSREEGNEEYNEFLDKFEDKKTTDDCYTPDLVYEAVADWVANEYGLDRQRFVRPFYPGGDYKKYKYAEGAIVVDNPPFSILAEILRWYKEHEVDFFLFGPTLTLFSSSSGCCAIPVGVSVTYENGAVVHTSFLTSLEDAELRIRTAPTLYEAVDAANREWTKDLKKELPKYSYPDEIITAAMAAKWCKYGVDYSVKVSETAPCSALDAQKKEGKAIFGKGYLLSERAAAERAAAERAAAERAAAERAAAERAAAMRWPLSEREREIVRQLGK